MNDSEGNQIGVGDTIRFTKTKRNGRSVSIELYKGNITGLRKDGRLIVNGEDNKRHFIKPSTTLKF